MKGRKSVSSSIKPSSRHRRIYIPPPQIKSSSKKRVQNWGSICLFGPFLPLMAGNIWHGAKTTFSSPLATTFATVLYYTIAIAMLHHPSVGVNCSADKNKFGATFPLLLLLPLVPCDRVQTGFWLRPPGGCPIRQKKRKKNHKRLCTLTNKKFQTSVH